MCDTNPRLIGLVGASGAGKSTLSKVLEREGFTRIAMAKPLKDMLAVLGMNKLDLYGPPSHRSKPTDFLCGKSPRHAMVTLGTEWGRDLIGPDLWVNAVQAQIIAHRTKCATRKGGGPCKGIVIEDVRFPNEWAMIARLGGELWRVRRPDVEALPSRLDRMRYSPRLAVRWLAAVITPAAKLVGHKPVHVSECHWPDAPAEAEFWNTGSEEELLAAVEGHLARVTPGNK